MGTKDDYTVKIKKYELVPPDGGWGYMICVATIIIFSMTTMFAGSFGMLFRDLLIELNMGTTSVSLLSGVCTMCVAIAGYLTSSLLTVMSMRKLTLLASVMFNLGVFCTVFVRSQLALYICQGPLQCAGFGILYNLCCTLLNEYFVKKRLLAISIAQTASAASAMVAPLIVKWSLEEFGFRGTLMFVSALSLHTFVGVALLQPVALHMKRVELPESSADEMKLLLVDKKTVDEKTITTPIITLKDLERSFDTSIKSDKNYNKSQGDTIDKEIKRIANEILDIPLIKQFLKSCASMGPTYSVFADILFSLMLPQALFAMGWSKNKVAQAIALIALGDLITRVSFVFLSKWLVKIGSQEIYIAGLLIAVLTRLGMLCSDSVTVKMIFITAMGISRCTIAMLPPLILADSYSPDKFSNVMGIFMMMMGLMNLILGPAIGAVRDLTESYPTAIYIITTGFAVVTLMWCVELCYKRNKHKRKLQREVVEKNLQRKAANRNLNKGK